VILAAADFDASSRDVAVTVTVLLLDGGTTGALYWTDVPVMSVRVPESASGEIVQVTPLCEF
jgi:hypothetical protein